MDQISTNAFPRLSSKYPWLVAQNLDGEEHNTRDLFFYSIHNELPYYRVRIPDLMGNRIRGCFHGWLILSNHPNNSQWSLWNQETSNLIRLPTLVLKDGGYESIGECCLSAPPNDPSSILLLTRTDIPTFVFFRLVSKRKNFKWAKMLTNKTKKSRWTEMSYDYQLKRLTSDGKLVTNLTCCNGKVYGLNTDGNFGKFVIHVDILVKDKEVVIKLMVFGAIPFSTSYYLGEIEFLKGSSTELFYIRIYFVKENKNIPTDVNLYKLDLTRINWKDRECFKDWNIDDDINYADGPKDDLQPLERSREAWEKIDDLKDAIFFLDLSRDHSVSYNNVIASEFGGFIHVRDGMGELIYSYHVKDDTISLFTIPSPMLPTSHLSMWENRIEDDHGEGQCVNDSKVEMINKDKVLLRSGMDDGVKFNESQLLNIPLDILETIMKHCVGVEYMNFRATCKKCHLVAPLIKWSNKTSITRLQWYSFVSPWLMVVNRKRGTITFTDPLSADNYFMKKPSATNYYGQLVPIVDGHIYCSRFGWLLFQSNKFNCLLFYNPFIDDILSDLPIADVRLESFCFSAPPTSSDCIVVGFMTHEYWRAEILLVSKDQLWRTLNLGPNPRTICFPTFYGGGLYALCKDGELLVISNLDKEDYSWKLVEAEAPKGSCTLVSQYFLTNCDQHLLLVSVGEYGGHVEVFKRNESKQEWEKIDSVGKHMIFVCGTTCLCIEAKVPKMENKIFFPRLQTKNRKVVFYSLDTCKYHTFDDENVQEHAGGFFGTTYFLSDNAWIEPCWS